MKQREKILAGIVGAILGVFFLSFGMRWLLVRPLRLIDATTARLQDQLRKLKEEKQAYFKAEDQLKEWTQRTFATDLDEASAKSGEMLTRMILRAGLKEEDFTRTPTGPQKMRGAKEIGWNIQGTGELEKLVHLIFLLEETPYLHRIEGFSVSPSDKSGRVKTTFRYETLVVDPAPDVQVTTHETRFSLDSPERKQYDVITARNLFQPYAPPPPPPETAPSAVPSGPGPETFRIVSLSEWKGVSEIHVLDLTHQTTQRYHVGDPLADAEIVMIDYRLLPEPGRDRVQSYARVILKGKDGDGYWAIEQGQTLAQKYRVTPDRLPPSLTQK